MLRDRSIGVITVNFGCVATSVPHAAIELVRAIGRVLDRVVAVALATTRVFADGPQPLGEVLTVLFGVQRLALIQSLTRWLGHQHEVSHR